MAAYARFTPSKSD